MKTLAVDLRSRSTPARWAWILLGAMVAAAIAMGLAVELESRKLDTLKAQRDDLLRQLAAAPQAPAVTVEKMPYDASAREMLALTTSEWPAMLTALESVEMAGVAPVALEIAPAQRWIRVEVEFADYAKLLEFVDGLNAGEPAPRWSLMQAQAGNRSSGASSAALSTATVRGTW